MFGYSKWNRAVNEAGQYCTAMFAGLEQLHGKPVPAQVFGDPYVAGFLQQLILHSVNANYCGAADPKIMISTAEATMDKLLPDLPGIGKQVIQGLIEVNKPTHPFHVNYMVGRREGGEYVVALLQNDEDKMHARMLGFREFVSRNYLSKGD